MQIGRTQKTAILLLALALWQAPALAGKRAVSVQTGVVVHVVDGDTIWLRPAQPGRKILKIRIEGIDAPEICQAGGAAARAALNYRLAGQRVTVAAHARDDYGRAVATVRWQGEDIGRWMVAMGHAWSYRYRGGAGPYAAEEARARAQGRGVFIASAAENPRQFRRRHGSCHR